MGNDETVETLKARILRLEDAICALGRKRRAADETAFAWWTALQDAQLREVLRCVPLGEIVVQTRLFGDTIISELRRLTGEDSKLLAQCRVPLPAPRVRNDHQVELPLAPLPAPPAKPARKPRASEKRGK